MKRPSMSPPEKTKRRKKIPTLLNQRQSLPHELLVSCFARVSRSYYPVLSLVSKRFRSLLTSPELYKLRESLGRTDSICLYVCLRFPSDPNPRWLALGHNHNLFHIPISNCPPLHSSSLIVLGSDIYNISGYSKKISSSSVSVLDCRTHTWHEAPSMLVERKSPSFRVWDGKIYVRGGQKRKTFPQKEVFDPKTQTWARVSDSMYTTRPRTGGCNMCGCNVWNIDPSVFRWDTEFVGPRRELMWDFSCFCMIEEVVYGYGDGAFKWLDTNVKSPWTNLEGMPKIDKSGFVKMVNYGGKIAVLWDKFVPSSGSEKSRVIQCAVIALERRNKKEIYGSVEWCDAVLTVSESCEFVNALVVNVDEQQEGSPREATSVGRTLSFDTGSRSRESKPKVESSNKSLTRKTPKLPPRTEVRPKKKQKVTSTANERKAKTSTSFTITTANRFRPIESTAQD